MEVVLIVSFCITIAVLKYLSLAVSIISWLASMFTNIPSNSQYTTDVKDIQDSIKKEYEHRRKNSKVFTLYKHL